MNQETRQDIFTMAAALVRAISSTLTAHQGHGPDALRQGVGATGTRAARLRPVDRGSHGQRAHSGLTKFPVTDLDDDSKYVRYSRRGVTLSSFLPRLPEIAGSVLVQFSEPAVYDALITLSHRDIVDALLPGLGVEPDAAGRPFLVHRDRDGWFVQLPNVRVWIAAYAVTKLCDTVDRLARRYLTAAEDLERHILRSIHFP